MSKNIERYDRQIRAWGFETQKKLESASILIIGSGIVAEECMKNLVLAGCGSIIVVSYLEHDEKLEYIRSLNPNTNIIVLSGHYNTSDIVSKFCITVIGCFDTFSCDNMASRSTIVLWSSDNVIYLSNSRELIRSEPYECNDPLISLICGAMASQMIIDYLPPSDSDVDLKLEMDMSTLASRVVRLQ